MYTYHLIVEDQIMYTYHLIVEDQIMYSFIVIPVNDMSA